MDSQEMTPAEAARSLGRKQRKQMKLLARIEKTAMRLARRRLKLAALESQIADLERHAAGVDRNGSSKQAVLLFNPMSGRKGENDHALRLSQIVDALRAHGIRASIRIKTSGKEARAVASEAARSGQPLLVVAAGDGTVEEVASQLVGTSTVLGIIPVGTMNNVARSLGVPLEIEDACALIGMGTARHIDVGRVLGADPNHDEYFLECAGMGLSAVAALAGESIEKHRWRVLPRALHKYFESDLGTIAVDLDDKRLEAHTRIVTVMNAPLMGSHLLAAPGAKMDDGLLDVCVYDGMGEAALAKHFLAAASGRPDNLKIYRAARIKITAQEPMLANTEANGAPPRRTIDIEIVPKALSVIVGNGVGLTLPVESAPEAPLLAADPPRRNGADDKVRRSVPEPSRAEGTS
jgi:YegS/Rv2252/BmrU family lipid kinase